MRMFKHNWIFTLLVFITFTCFAGDPRIGDNYALIIIDMQPSFVTRGGNDQDPANVKKVHDILENQKKLIELAKKQNMPIIFLEYEGMGETNAELKKAAEGYGCVQYFTKTTDGMFESGNKNEKQLSDYLRSENVGNLIITGANGGACVSESISGSLANNYNVLAYNDGIADFNYKDFIYPYVDQYHFTPTCESCKFQEIKDYATMSMWFALKNQKVSGAEVDNSGRAVIKDVPVRKPAKVMTKAKPKPEARAQ